MLYQAIRKACGKYHSTYGWDYDTALSCYRDALARRRSGLNPNKPSCEEAWILLSFANGWNARMQASFLDVRRALFEIESDLEKLRDKTILDLCLDETIDGVRIRCRIKRCFVALEECGGGSAVVGASKIIHILNSDLFVMWHTAIIEKYGCGKFILYTDFLSKMQKLAKCAIKQVKENESYRNDEAAIASLTGCKHTLAKTLDEYNFMKYTKCCGSVWKAEHKSFNSA